MNKLSNEQLLKAYNIGATHYVIRTYCKAQEEGYLFYCNTSRQWHRGLYLFETRINNDTKIDFSPLYEWMEWSGDDCPVAEDVLVDVKVRGDEYKNKVASDLCWVDRITQWKLSKPASSTSETPAELLPINNWYTCNQLDNNEVYLIGYYDDCAVVVEKGNGEMLPYDEVSPSSLSPIKTNKQKFIEQVTTALDKADTMELSEALDFIWDNGYGKLPTN